jgi:hypothetical protein
MCSIIRRFRTHPFAFTTDIEKAFLHVHVGLKEHHRNFTHFLWLSNPNDPECPFATYHFKVVLFGSASASSPFMLNATLQHHLGKYSTQNIEENLYVDNLIWGCETEDEAIDYYNEARSTMSQGQFNLRSWASNSQQLCSRVAKDHTEDKSEEVNVLGLRWNPKAVKITLAQNHSNLTQKSPMTKRTVLQQSAKVYDPLALITPLTVRARILIQELWRRNLSWDTPIPANLQQKWSSIAAYIYKSINEHGSLPIQYFLEPIKPQENV